MSPAATLDTRMRGEDGFTLIELMLAMVLGLIVSLMAFSLLNFTSRDVTRITDRVHVDQTGRVALERIIQELHSACVAPTIKPVLFHSTATTIKFISETSTLNEQHAPVSSLSTVKLHEIEYVPATSSLVERLRPSSGISPAFTFNESETPEPTSHTLLTNVTPTKSTAIFRYYRYWEESDTGFKASEDAGKLNPTPLIPATAIEAEAIAAVVVSFTLAPEGRAGAYAEGDRPVALEDSAILRLAPSSEASGLSNEPCTELK
jgi:prepilin-type N-terminal cleavage/methylation domain-containing protein